LYQGANLLGLTHISTYGQSLYALCDGLLCDGAEMIRITARKHQVCPIRRHAEGNATPNTRAASSDQDDFLTQEIIGKDAHDITRLVEQRVAD
jgi:hypothetical protein